jgi:hypothetical protein
MFWQQPFPSEPSNLHVINTQDPASHLCLSLSLSLFLLSLSLCLSLSLSLSLFLSRYLLFFFSLSSVYQITLLSDYKVILSPLFERIIGSSLSQKLPAETDEKVRLATLTIVMFLTT